MSSARTPESGTEALPAPAVSEKFVTTALGLALLSLLSTVPLAGEESFAHPHGALKRECLECHSTDSWSPLRSPLPYRHTETGFDLVGGHAGLACKLCHATLDFAQEKGQTDCYGCHEPAFSRATRPVHTGFATTCSTCHSVASWQPAVFDHNRAAFHLAGAHRTAECIACHRNGYTATPTDCFNCHQRDFNGARNPVHGGFATSCEDCHGVTAWRPAIFDHGQTGFQLVGAHRTIECTLCHRNGYGGTPSECVSCHRASYDGAGNPSHSGFPVTCQDCHSATAWQPATFDHNATGFQLAVAHRSVACTACHRSGYAGTPSDCLSCHQADYSGAASPSHAGFPTACQSCHGTTAWQPASFDHNSTGFPLTGAHRSLACTTCHRSGYAGTPSDCFACHQSDYNGTHNPNHSSAGFGTGCAECHGTNGWTPATFNHESSFPIASGRHQFPCTSCHVAAGNYGVFECVLCHEHSQGETNGEHRGVGGYVYESRACYQCHPRGRE